MLKPHISLKTKGKEREKEVKKEGGRKKEERGFNR